MGVHDMPGLNKGKAIAIGLFLVVVVVVALLRGSMPGDEPAQTPAPSAPSSSSQPAAQAVTDRPTGPLAQLGGGAGTASPQPPAPAPGATEREAPASARATARGSVLAEGEDNRSAGVVPPEPAGVLDREAIRAGIGAAKPKIAECYESALAHDPDLSGMITVEFTIEAVDGGGAVTAGEVNQTNMNAPFFEACVLKQVVDVPFPAPTGGGVVKVKYPFNFFDAAD